MHMRGTVISLSTTSLTISNKKGHHLTFGLTAKTKYRQKKAQISLSSIKSGETVVVIGHHTGSSQPTALVVRLP